MSQMIRKFITKTRSEFLQSRDLFQVCNLNITSCLQTLALIRQSPCKYYFTWNRFPRSSSPDLTHNLLPKNYFRDKHLSAVANIRSDDLGQKQNKNENNKPVWKFSAEINELTTLKQPVPNSEWEKLEALAVKNSMSPNVLESKIMGICLNNHNFEVAKSFLDYLTKSGREPNVIALSRFIRLCGKSIDSAGEDIILSTYQKLCDAHGSFDSVVLSHLIHGLARTSQWQECLKLVEQHNQLQKPNPHIHNIVCGAAFKNNRKDIAQDILMKMLRNSSLPSGHTLINWIEQCELNTTSNKTEQIKEILQFCSKYMIYLPESVVEKLRALLPSQLNGEWQAEYIDIPSSGTCPHCHTVLEPSYLTNEEFRTLQNQFLDRIGNGLDSYFRISQKEYEEFKQNIQHFYPYDYVVDASSLALYDNRKASLDKQQNQLCTALNSLQHDTEKKLLVIAPLEMSLWKNTSVDYVRRKHNWFFSQSINRVSLMIMASLYGGPNTKLVRQNLLNNYNYNLNEIELMSVFKRWQMSHLVTFQRASLSETLEFQPIVSYNPVAQMTKNAIHIPCTNLPGPTVTAEIPSLWLCLKNESNDNSQTKKMNRKDRAIKLI